ncbi:hypothetical protein KGQ31_00335, partial [Patescibacteria group bacterium]|nr:hypothetical protein [Patescibacteria group bacterium]
MRSLVHFFDKLEDGVRERLSHTPIPYAIIGGVTIILLWRGIWHLADELQALGGIWAIIFDPAVSVVISAAILLMTGLFVSFFIG